MTVPVSPLADSSAQSKDDNTLDASAESAVFEQQFEEQRQQQVQRAKRLEEEKVTELQAAATQKQPEVIKSTEVKKTAKLQQLKDRKDQLLKEKELKEQQELDAQKVKEQQQKEQEIAEANPPPPALATGETQKRPEDYVLETQLRQRLERQQQMENLKKLSRK